MTSGRGSVYNINMSIDQAVAVRDALAKALYERLFSWSVEQINTQLSPGGGFGATPIGIIDIFGFERFDHNSLEQLLINLANETLQQHFAEQMFKTEQETYKREGLPWETVTFSDNMKVLEAINRRVISLLNEECNLPKGSDESFLAKVNSGLPTPGTLRGAARGRTDAPLSRSLGAALFTVNHFAGPVEYDVTGFLEKNKDTVPPELPKLLSQSTQPFIANLFRNQEAPLTKSLRMKTICTTFQTQLEEMTMLLKQAFQHYVRCFKSTTRAQPLLWEGQLVGDQLSNAGVLETVRIRKAGFPWRVSFEEFSTRYVSAVIPLSKLTDVPLSLSQSAISAFLGKFSAGPNEYYVGSTKVFFRNAQFNALEKLRERHLARMRAIPVIQAGTAAFVARKQYSVKLQQKREEERRRREEAERKRKEEEERKRREEEERRLREEEEKRRREEEEKRRREEERAKEQARLEGLKRQEEVRRAEEARRLEEAKSKQEAQRLEDERRRAEESRRRMSEAEKLESLKKQAEAMRANNRAPALPMYSSTGAPLGNPNNPDESFFRNLEAAGSPGAAKSGAPDDTSFMRQLNELDSAMTGFGSNGQPKKRDSLDAALSFLRKPSVSGGVEQQPLSNDAPASNAPANAEPNQAASPVVYADLSTITRPVEPAYGSINAARQALASNTYSGEASPSMGRANASPNATYNPNSPLATYNATTNIDSPLATYNADGSPGVTFSPAGASGPPSLFTTEKDKRKTVLQGANSPLTQRSAAHRAEVVEELFATERDYFFDLRLIIEVFLEPMRSQTLINEQEIQHIFSNVEVLRGFHLVMLNDLKKVTRAEVKPPDGGEIGKVFLRLADCFKFYTQYCTNQPEAVQTLTRAMQRAEVKAWLDARMYTDECRGLAIGSFLIKPVQRICKYPLFIAELIKHTPPEHPDYPDLQIVRDKIEDIMLVVNESKRASESMQIVANIQTQFYGGQGIVTPTRRLVAETPVFLGTAKEVQSVAPSKEAEHMLFIFNDLLLIGKPRRRYPGTYTQLAVVDPKDIEITVLAKNSSLRHSSLELRFKTKEGLFGTKFSNVLRQEWKMKMYLIRGKDENATDNLGPFSSITAKAVFKPLLLPHSCPLSLTPVRQLKKLIRECHLEKVRAMKAAGGSGPISTQSAAEIAQTRKKESEMAYADKEVLYFQKLTTAFDDLRAAKQPKALTAVHSGKSMGVQRSAATVAAPARSPPPDDRKNSHTIHGNPQISTVDPDRPSSPRPAAQAPIEMVAGTPRDVLVQRPASGQPFAHDNYGGSFNWDGTRAGPASPQPVRAQVQPTASPGVAPATTTPAVTTSSTPKASASPAPQVIQPRAAQPQTQTQSSASSLIYTNISNLAPPAQALPQKTAIPAPSPTPSPVPANKADDSFLSAFDRLQAQIDSDFPGIEPPTPAPAIVPPPVGSGSFNSELNATMDFLNSLAM